MVRIKELRQSKNIPQKQLAIDLHVSQPTVSDWESGRKTPSAHSTQKLADYFGVTVDYLLGRSDDPYMFPVPPELSLRGITDKDEINRRINAIASLYRADIKNEPIPVAVNNIRTARLNAGYSQKQVALELGVSAPTVSEWESGKKNPISNNLQKMSDMFGVSVDYLLGRTDIKKEPAPKGDEPGDPLDVQLMELLCRMTPDQKKWLLEKIDTLLELQ